jgi:cell division protein ZapA (FtsZ GTPase activity inhibitor)
MAGLSGTLTSIVVSMLTSATDGVNVRIGAMEAADSSLDAMGIATIVALNASAEISEKTGYVQYPALLVYCDKLSNTLKEKFRQFSGKAHVVVEVRHSQDDLDGMGSSVDVYVDAVCALLDDSRGDLGSGLFYSGGYEVSCEPVVRGGMNFLQRAKVGFDVEVSK